MPSSTNAFALMSGIGWIWLHRSLALPTPFISGLFYRSRLPATLQLLNEYEIERGGRHSTPNNPAILGVVGLLDGTFDREVHSADPSE